MSDLSDVATALAARLHPVTGEFRKSVEAEKAAALAKRSLEIEFVTEPSEAFWKAYEADKAVGRIK